ncbi:MAG: hypothetical protein K8953_00530, partial [Proteobacteria bacterium]|nr:hypothetical protein [Pseudomonadota bacterium]
GAVLPNTTASATWYGRAFVKTDATAFNSDNERQISLDVDFAEGTIDTPAPVNFTIGTQTHSLSVRGRFGLHDFARRSFVPSATGLLSGFVEYTHHGALSAAKFDLIGLIGADGALGIFKGNVAGVGLIGGFEVTPPELETYLPNHTAYLEQFRGYINTRIMGEDNRSELAEGTATAVNRQGSNTPNYAATFRLRGVVDTQDDNYADGFAFIAFDGNRNKAVAILSGTDLGMPVTSNTESAIWAGQLVVNPAYTTATAKNSAVNLQVNFAAGTIETLQPITILAYEAGDPGVHKQSLEIKGIFGSHVDAFGLRTGTLGGTVEYTVGHYALDANLTNHTSSQRTLATKHRRVTARLPLRGLIGKEGAIGVFHGTVAGADFADVHVVGGFEVSPRAEITSTTVSFDRWARGATQCGAINLTVSTIDFDIECATRKAIIFAHPNDLFLSDEDFTGSNTKRQGFVLGNDVGIDLTRGLSPASATGLTLKTLTLGNDPSFNNQGERFLLSDNGGAATDGVAFIGDGFDNSIYAGLLSGTDLGAPLALNSALQVSWPGTLLYLVNGSPLDGGNFALTVDFANRGISWEAEASGGFILEGSYDEFGVITGIIKAKASLSSTGSVSGLIGVEGAVGAFVINTLDRFRVGGFVAAPVTKSKVTGYAHFSAHHGVLTGERELHDDLTTGDIAAFVVGTPTGLDNSTLTFGAGEFGSTAYKLGDDSASPSGFALLNGKFGADKRLRAGLLSGTDVGAVVSARVNGLWTGTANVAYTHSMTGANTFRSFALILDVDFAAGTIRTRTKALSGTDGLLISGVFGDNVDIDLPQGILGGEVTYQFQANGNDPENANLPLIGLIGGDGAIGVFTKTSGAFSYAGGFTAQPFALTDVGKVPAPAAVTVAQLQNFATLPTARTTHTGGLLKLGSTFSSTNLPTFPDAPDDTGEDYELVTDGFVMLRNDIEGIGGVAYYSIIDNEQASGAYVLHYAGILSDTNLGAPVSSTDATMTWTGVFSEHNSRDSADKDNFIKFHVDFGAGELQFRNTADTGGGGTLVRGGNTYTLNARFGHGALDEHSNTILTTGQLGGHIKRSTSFDDNQLAAISGLIGEKGAVGVFVDPKNVSLFVGGFWAVPELGDEPDKKTGLVNFADWEDSFGRGHNLPRRITSPQTSEFLAGRETVVNENGLDDTGRTNYGRVVSGANFAGGTIARFALDFGSDSLTYGDYPLGADATGGVAGFWQANGAHRYAGLLSSTNVGAPINSIGQSGAWRGRFVVYRAISNLIFTTHRDFTLNVTFDAGGGGTLTMANITDSQTSTNNYRMVGGKYDERGVISGKINFHHTTNSTNFVFSSFLTGLIGQDGAVGAFIAGRGTIDDIQLHPTRSNNEITRFFGGFVATGKSLIDAPASPSANHEQFNWYYKNYGAGDRRLFASFADSGEDVKTAFLEASQSGVFSGFSSGTSSIRLREDADNSNGFVLGVTGSAPNQRFRVGLLPETSLGAVFAAAPSLFEWTGSIHLLTDAGTVRTTNRLFTLDFDAGTITTPDLAIGTNDTIRIAGTFKFGTNNSLLGEGILGGSAFFTDTSETTTTELALIGLIGTDGAIGVFHGAVGVGGFEAAPPRPGTAAFWVGNARDATNAAALVIPATAMTQAYSFVQAGATELNLTNSNAADNRVVKLSDISGNDNNTSGFALGSIGQAG